MSRYTLVIHGGAGTILKQDLTEELEKAYKDCLDEALTAGYSILEKDGTAVDAVKAAIVVMEDNVLFNAGRGSVFTNGGVQEMDAAIMNGKDLSAGAVAGVRNVRNPIKLATEIMLHSEHVFLSGSGALDFAKQQNMGLEDDAYFFSQYRYDQLKAAKEEGTTSLDHNSKQLIASLLKDKKYGTIGAVACDKKGNLAAATSTGGMTNKRWGRVGDSPMIGAGTYANNNTCAISCTGHGELFIRAVAAYDVSCLMEYKGLNLQEAANTVVMEKLVKLRGEGGLIGVDAAGNPVLCFNSEGMYRGVKSSDGLHQLGIYKE
jgi:L-asparaginase / beta-aspartyl-peptidase